MDSHESNLFEKLPNEVLQLIFAAIGDCKTLVLCMVVSKAFQNHASKVNSLRILFPKQFPTYDQKLWNIYSMVKTFKDLESLIVYIGQPKKEPPASWARCMRYAEIGVAVEKFIFMAAKSGDFVEFDTSLGLRSQLIDNITMKIENENVFSNESKDIALENVNIQQDVEPQLLVNKKTALFGEDDDRDLNNNSHDEFNTSRTIDSNRAIETTLTPKNVQESSSTNRLNLNKNSLENEKGESSERFKLPDHAKSKISFCSKTYNFPNLLQFNQENLHLPIINFHLKQVIAPSNDVLKRMVPVIVFAIVQGLDEFRDSVPNFIEKFVNLKRFVLVDIVESLTVHMREHQIQQVRTQRIETISRFTSESVVPKSNAKTGSKSEKHEIEERNAPSKNQNLASRCFESNKVELLDEKDLLDVEKNALLSNKGEELKNAPLRLQIHEIKTKFLDSEFHNKPSMFESCLQKERTWEEEPKIHEIQTSQNCNQIIRSPISSSLCNVCQGLESQGNNVGICWHCSTNGPSISIPSINYIKSNILSCNLPQLPHVERLIGKWSCNDPSLKAWLKGKQSLAGPEDISHISNKTMTKIECMPSEDSKIKDCTRIRTFEEIMACRLRDDLDKKLPNISIISKSRPSNEGASNQTILNSRVTFSTNHNSMPIKKNNNQLMSRPTTSIIKKAENSKYNKVSEFFLERSHTEKSIEEEDSKSDSWEKPASCKGSSGSSSASFNSFKSENPNLNFGVHRFSTPQTKLYGKNKVSLNKRNLLDDSKNDCKTRQPKYKSNNRKYKTVKESNSNYIGKHSFKRGLQKETSRRREGDRASRIANSRRYTNSDCPSKICEWREDLWTKKIKKESIPLLECGTENPKDFWNFTNKAECFGNEIKLGDDVEDQGKQEDTKGKKIVLDCSNDRKTTSSSEIPLETHDQIIIQNQDEANYNILNNENLHITSLHGSEQLSPIAPNHDENVNAIGFEGVILVPYESDSTIFNNQLQGLCDLEDANSESRSSFHDSNIINIEDYPRADLSPSLSSRDDDMPHNEVAWTGFEILYMQRQPLEKRHEFDTTFDSFLGVGLDELHRARARERSAMRRIGRRSRTRSMRRENHAHVEREREARRERLREGIQKRQRDIEQEALFFDISFWRSEQVATQNYALSEVSMCIATHNAKPLNDKELEMLSTVALAGPLLVATITFVNEQIGSHNL